jgi:ABC-type glycerol-3-phosphate transport system permease component
VGDPAPTRQMQGVFEDLSAGMEECTLVIGSSWLEASARIALRPVAPGLAATAILSVVFNEQEFLIASGLMERRSRPLPGAVTRSSMKPTSTGDT